MFHPNEAMILRIRAMDDKVEFGDLISLYNQNIDDLSNRLSMLSSADTHYHDSKRRRA